jgi:rhomboid family GlyGly-CTERM serine protease
VGHALGTRAWLLVWIASIVAVSAGLWVLEPHLVWYVGLSGVLHGLLAAGIIADFDHRAETWALALVLAAKLGWEQFAGPLPGSEATSGGAVIVNAHLYGATGGVLAGILIRVRAKAYI